ncbi:MAG: hypothetical protein M9945_16625 [Aquamicrobium sp.]|uniref:hypothetical protein n=1 Tax=Aquamicrobium sp. TaxID=1872579 RepID=UPI00349E7CBB|nr:hypothetical protein [Aquamicrobium sp.]
MTVKVASVLLDYCSCYIAGSLDVDVLIEYGATGVFGTDECLVVTCLPWNEGETRITLGPIEKMPLQPASAVFDGMLKTPDYRVVVLDVNMPEIVATDVPGVETRIRIWTNDPICLDDVIIALE